MAYLTNNFKHDRSENEIISYIAFDFFFIVRQRILEVKPKLRTFVRMTKMPYSPFIQMNFKIHNWKQFYIGDRSGMMVNSQNSLDSDWNHTGFEPRISLTSLLFKCIIWDNDSLNFTYLLWIHHWKKCAKIHSTM